VPFSATPVFHTLLEGASMGSMLTMGSASRNMPEDASGPGFTTAKRRVLRPTRNPEEILYSREMVQQGPGEQLLSTMTCLLLRWISE
jgi:hypothetical protein